MFLAAEPFDSLGDFGGDILMALRYLFRGDSQAGRKEMI